MHACEVAQKIQAEVEKQQQNVFQDRSLVAAQKKKSQAMQARACACVHCNSGVDRFISTHFRIHAFMHACVILLAGCAEEASSSCRDQAREVLEGGEDGEEARCSCYA